MQFRECDAAGILRGEVAHDHVFLKRNFAAGVSLLLEPGKPPAVGLKAGHDIVEAVAVDIIYRHFPAARAGAIPAAEVFGMIGPRCWATFRWLFPPAVRIDEVHAPVPVDVSNAHTMIRPRTLLRHGMSDPHTRWFGRIRLRVHDDVVWVLKNEFQLAVAVDIFQ